MANKRRVLRCKRGVLVNKCHVLRCKRGVLINKHRVLRCKRRVLINKSREIRVSSRKFPAFLGKTGLILIPVCQKCATRRKSDDEAFLRYGEATLRHGEMAL